MLARYIPLNKMQAKLLEHDPVDRMEAVRRGARYYKGEPCPKGHDGWRYTNNFRCVACASEKNKQQHRRKWTSDTMRKIDAKHSEREFAKLIDETYDYDLEDPI